MGRKVIGSLRSPPVRTLLLDIGGVVLRSGHEMMARLGQRLPELAPVTDRRGRLGPDPDPRWEAALSGTLSERAYWAERAAELGELTGDGPAVPRFMDRLYDSSGGGDDLVRPAARTLMEDVAGAGGTVAALTNDLAAFHGDADVARHPLFALFDPLVDGSVTGVLKPDPRAYRLALDALGDPDPADVVFLDDMPANVAGARRAGLTTIQVDLTDPDAAFDRARTLLALAPSAA
jgi:putative hydrolase of the HAD superfamily